MSSDTPKSPPRTPLGMIDALIGQPAAKPAKKPKGRSVLLAHALAQRENRLIAEKRAAASRLAEPEPKPAAAAAQPAMSTPATLKPAAPARPAGKPVPERPSLDAMIVKALGASAHGHVRNGAFDRQSALADLIARTQTRLGTAGRAHAPVPALSAPASVAKGDRERMIAVAMRTHREQQQVFDELSARQRATLRATAEAMVAKRAS